MWATGLFLIGRFGSAFGGQVDGLAQSLQHAAFVGFAGARDVESRAVVDGCAHHGQSDRDVYTGLDAQHLDWSVTLVVVHGDDAIEVSARRPKEERIGWQRS